ncbi:MAG: hypothetical protein JRD89_00270 [Deltaproteobacteria bacterium]|nr:hypothetical protein [Deltaproteobacteria bacterium]
MSSLVADWWCVCLKEQYGSVSFRPEGDEVLLNLCPSTPDWHDIVLSISRKDWMLELTHKVEADSPSILPWEVRIDAGANVRVCAYRPITGLCCGLAVRQVSEELCTAAIGVSPPLQAIVVAVHRQDGLILLEHPINIDDVFVLASYLDEIAKRYRAYGFTIEKS